MRLMVPESTMSSESQVAPATPLPRTVNGVEDAGVLVNSVHAIKSLIEAVRVLASHKDYKLVASHFDETARLQSEFEAKESELTAHKTVNATLATERSSLETKLKERDDTIAKLKTQEESLQKQVRQLEESSNKQKEAMKYARSRTKDLESSMKARDDRIKELENRCSQERSRALQLENDLDGVKNENAFLVQRLDASNGRLAELEGFAVQLKEEDLETSVNRIENLWEYACRFVESYFQENIPDASLQSSRAWERLRKPALFQHHVPLPQTNSVPAKQMRIAIILAILARSIDRHIFHPTYILGEDSGLREMLLRQAVRNSKKESFCRALLLSMLPDEQEIAAEDRVEQVIEDVMWNAKELLPAAKVGAFQSELERLAWRACDTWGIIRRTRERFEPSFELAHLEDLGWQTLLFDANAAGEIEQKTVIQGGRDDELLVVLPRLYIVEKNHVPEPVTAGTVLRRSQSLAAAQELEEQPSSPAFGRATSSRCRPQKPRNLSISVYGNRSSEVQAFLEQGGGSSGH